MISQEQIRAARAALNLTLDDLAREAGISRPTAFRLEHGGASRGGTLDKVQAAFERLGVTFDPDGKSIRWP